jgi:hypothetical protein
VHAWRGLYKARGEEIGGRALAFGEVIDDVSVVGNSLQFIPCRRRKLSAKTDQHIISRKAESKTLLSLTCT